MTEQWQELKKTIIELRDNDGTGTQQEICKFLANLMDILEKQMQEPKTGKWIMHLDDLFPSESSQECSICHALQPISIADDNYCPHCGARMEE